MFTSTLRMRITPNTWNSYLLYQSIEETEATTYTRITPIMHISSMPLSINTSLTNKTRYTAMST